MADAMGRSGYHKDSEVREPVIEPSIRTTCSHKSPAVFFGYCQRMGLEELTPRYATNDRHDRLLIGSCYWKLESCHGMVERSTLHHASSMDTIPGVAVW